MKLLSYYCNYCTNIIWLRDPHHPASKIALDVDFPKNCPFCHNKLLRSPIDDIEYEQ